MRHWIAWTDLCEHARPERPSDDSRMLGHVLWGGVKCIDARFQQFLNGRGHGRGVSGSKGTNHFLDEERVALRSLDDRAANLRSQSGGVDLLDQSDRAVPIKRHQWHRDGFPRLRGGVARRTDEQATKPRHVAENVREHRERRFVRPMEVLDGERERTKAAPVLQEEPQHLRQLATLALRVQARSRGVAENLEEQRHGAGFERKRKRSDASLDRPSRLVLLSGLLDAERLPDHVGDESVPLAALICAASRRQLPNLRRQPPAKFLYESGLAHAGLTEDVNESPSRRRGIREQRRELCELRLTAQDRRGAGRRCFELCSDHTVCRNRMGFALQSQRRYRLELEALARQLGRCFAYEHVIRWRRGLDALRGVDHVARDGVCEDLARQQTGDDLACVHTDTHRQPDRILALEALVLLAYRSLDTKCGVDGARRVVLMRHRSAEYSHHRVADELVDRPAKALDLSRHGAVIHTKDRLKAFGLQWRRQRPSQVREQDRDDLPLLLEQMCLFLSHL